MEPITITVIENKKFKMVIDFFANELWILSFNYPSMTCWNIYERFVTTEIQGKTVNPLDPNTP